MPSDLNIMIPDLECDCFLFHKNLWDEMQLNIHHRIHGEDTKIPVNLEHDTLIGIDVYVAPDEKTFKYLLGGLKAVGKKVVGLDDDLKYKEL